jgi:nitronate monooxygenase
VTWALTELPIVGAPLAGGPSTPALAAAVSDAGGLGFVAAGYRSAAETAADVAAVGARPFGVNLLVPGPREVEDVGPYAERLAPEAERQGVPLGEPRWSDDDWDAKLELVLCVRPAVVSFTFGAPSRDIVDELRRAGIRVWVTVTSPADVVDADALIVQGAEAGGHRGGADDTDAVPLAELLGTIETDLPLIAAGGIGDAAGVRAALSAGAAAVQVGTALLLTPEAGTSEPHRDALSGDAPTRLTRAFSGRRARGIENRFLREHDAHAPRAYPHVHYLTAPVRAAARAAGDADAINLWAGTSYRLARAEPAAAVVARLASGL